MHAIVLITQVYLHKCVFVYTTYCSVCVCVCLHAGSSHCSTLYKHISRAAQREGERASRQPGTEAS